MIKARCFRCGFALMLTEQHIANALAAEGITEKPGHYMAECPHCRRMNKVSLKGVLLPAPEETEQQAPEAGRNPATASTPEGQQESG